MICPITSVELKNEGCSDTKTGTEVNIGASPYPITAKKNVVAGYTKKVCVKATIQSVVAS